MAVSGAYLLAEELGAALEEEEIASALQRYEHSLKPDIQKRQRAGRRFAKWLHGIGQMVRPLVSA